MAKQVYGLPTQGGGFGSDAKAPDFQRRHRGRRRPADALLGADSLVGLGCFDGAQTTSLATIVLHHDAAGLVKEGLRRVSPFDAAPTASSTTSARSGPAATSWGGAARAGAPATPGSPAVLRRGTFEASRGRTLVQDALERARELLATHEVAPLPDDVDRHLDEVIAAQRRLAPGTA